MWVGENDRRYDEHDLKSKINYSPPYHDSEGKPKLPSICAIAHSSHLCRPWCHRCFVDFFVNFYTFLLLTCSSVRFRGSKPWRRTLRGSRCESWFALLCLDRFRCDLREGPSKSLSARGYGLGHFRALDAGSRASVCF